MFELNPVLRHAECFDGWVCSFPAYLTSPQVWEPIGVDEIRRRKGKAHSYIKRASKLSLQRKRATAARNHPSRADVQTENGIAADELYKIEDDLFTCVYIGEDVTFVLHCYLCNFA